MKLEEMKKICDEATPGPWQWMWAHPAYLLHQIDPEDENKTIDWVLDAEVSDDGNDCNVTCRYYDREFIAVARTMLPKLNFRRAVKSAQCLSAMRY